MGTSVTVRPVSAEEKVEESDEGEFEEGLETERIGEEVEKLRQKRRESLSGRYMIRGCRVKRRLRDIVSVGMWSFGIGVTCV